MTALAIPSKSLVSPSSEKPSDCQMMIHCIPLTAAAVVSSGNKKKPQVATPAYIRTRKRDVTVPMCLISLILYFVKGMNKKEPSQFDLLQQCFQSF